MNDIKIEIQFNKPPIGLMPKKLWIEERYILVKHAIQRYMESNIEVPTEWMEEYNELVNQI